MHRIFRLLVVSFFLTSAAALAQAQGIIVPGPCQRCPDIPRQMNLPRVAANQVHQD